MYQPELSCEGDQVFQDSTSSLPFSLVPSVVALPVLVSLSVLLIESLFQERSYVISHLHIVCLCLSWRMILFSMGS